MEEVLKAIISLTNKVDNLTNKVEDLANKVEDLTIKVDKLEVNMDKGFEAAKEEQLEFFNAGAKAHSKLEKRVSELERKIG
ncbi:MAG: hypothetical protein Q4D77_08525 [Peptostreptococcaceae bacterium]|nr:hypothetical protein [Peptostreptococcaceae bacterium]